MTNIHTKPNCKENVLKSNTKSNDYCRILKFQQTKGLARLEATNDNLADAEKGFTTLNMAVSRFICHLKYWALQLPSSRSSSLLPIHASISASEPAICMDVISQILAMTWHQHDQSPKISCGSHSQISSCLSSSHLEPSKGF